MNRNEFDKLDRQVDSILALSKIVVIAGLVIGVGFLAFVVWVVIMALRFFGVL